MIDSNPSKDIGRSSMEDFFDFKLFGPDPDAIPFYTQQQKGEGHRFINHVYRVMVKLKNSNHWENLGTAWAHGPGRLVTAAHVATLVKSIGNLRLVPSDPNAQIISDLSLDTDFTVRLHDDWAAGRQYYESDIAVIDFKTEMFGTGLKIFTFSHKAWRRRKADVYIIGGHASPGSALIAPGPYFSHRTQTGRIFYTANTISGMSGAPVTTATRQIRPGYWEDVVSAMHLGYSSVPYRRINKNHGARFEPYTLNGIGLKSIGEAR